MKRYFLVYAAAGALVALSACNREEETVVNPGQTDAVNAAQDATGAAVGQVAAPMGAMTTDGYVSNAAIADMYEVEAGKLAGTMAKSADVKAFGQMMVTDHTATTTEMTPLASAAGVAPPAEMDQRRKGFIDNLKAAGADFDKVYIDQQVAAHDEALTLHRSYADGGDNAGLKAFAAKTAPKVEQHLQKARSLQGSMTGAAAR